MKSLSRKPAPVTETECGKCGYRVTGLPTFQCPECGMDLREVGIVTREVVPARRRFGMRDLPRDVRLRLVRTFILMGALMVLIDAVVFFSTPSWATGHYITKFTPRSKAFTRLELTTDFRTLQLMGKRYEQQQANLGVEVTFVAADGSPHAMNVDLPSFKMSYEVTRG